MPNRNAQLIIIISAGVLLFVAAQWPRLTIPGCLVMLTVVGLALRKMGTGAPSAANGQPRRRTWRRAAGISIALALLLWALLSLRRG